MSFVSSMKMIMIVMGLFPVLSTPEQKQQNGKATASSRFAKAKCRFVPLRLIIVYWCDFMTFYE